MLLSEFLQFPNKFVKNERELFTKYESSNMINTYVSMNDQNLSKDDKIVKIKNMLKFCEYAHGTEKKKIICLLVFSILKTEFGRSLIQESERFRRAALGRYEDFMTEDDQDFTEVIKDLKF